MMSRKLHLLTLILGLSLSVASCGKPASVKLASPLDKARDLAMKGDLDAALVILNAERDQAGLTAELGLLMGGVLEGRGEPSAAVSIYRKTAEAFPGSGTVELRMANIFLDLGQTEAALKRFKAAREAGVGDSELALSMAVVYGLLEKFEEAEAELDRAEKSGAEPGSVKYNRGLLLRQSGNKARSRDVFAEAHEASPNDPSILRELAQAELALVIGEDLSGVARAEEYINQSISLIEAKGRSDWRGYEVLGDCFLARSDHAAASEMYLKAKEIGEDPHPRLDDKYYEAQVVLRAMLSGEGN